MDRSPRPRRRCPIGRSVAATTAAPAVGDRLVFGGAGARWWDSRMSWETHPVTPDRFEDFAVIINRARRVTHCWCLSHRLQAAEIEQLGDGNREQAMRRDHRSTDIREHAQRLIVRTFEPDAQLTGPVDKMWVLCGKRQIGADGRRVRAEAPRQRSPPRPCAGWRGCCGRARA